jgi:hypothetical protein
MCQVFYNRISCHAPATVKEATNCQGKVREQSHTKICVNYCEAKQVIELRNGAPKWGKGLCRDCRTYAKEQGMSNLLSQYDMKTGFSIGMVFKFRPDRRRRNTPTLSGRCSRKHGRVD